MTEPTTTMAPPALLKELSRRSGEPEWMQARRETAWQRFEAAAAPRLEKTDLRKRSFSVGTLPVLPGQLPADAALLLEGLEGPLVCTVDGTVTELRLPAALKEQGVVLCDLEKAVREQEELVLRHFGTVVSAAESKWTAQNEALWHGGAFLYVPRGVSVDVPFVIVHVETSKSEGWFPRTLVIGAENSAFSVAQVRVAAEESGAAVHSSVTEVVALGGSQIDVSCVNELRKGPTHFVTERAWLGDAAVVNWTLGDVSDGFALSLVESVLSGTGSRSLTQGVGLGYGRQHMDLTVSMDHRGRHSESDIRLQGVLRGRANAIYRSSTHIERGAVNAGSEQHDRMLIMDKTARADAIPMLLIDENDVQRCGHAASVGKLNADDIYYLMSRGIPRDLATRMMIWGYLRPIVETISAQKVQAWLSGLIERKLTP